MSNHFLEHFSEIEDPRIERCKKHELLDIIFLSVCAVLGDRRRSLIGRRRLGIDRGIWRSETGVAAEIRTAEARYSVSRHNSARDVAAESGSVAAVLHRVGSGGIVNDSA
ncbi:MAG: hypothetical protein CVU63_17475 [Deltaproteobacteria bacterium HGW-Deltaproteobacteria-20]|nr:MAG: hypothetical protein CVU63_17475 [Deltaproteobacteria bacterium HGW-Deltaproteobacteria-20]